MPRRKTEQRSLLFLQNSLRLQRLFSTQQAKVSFLKHFIKSYSFFSIAARFHFLRSCDVDLDAIKTIMHINTHYLAKLKKSQQQRQTTHDEVYFLHLALHSTLISSIQPSGSVDSSNAD